MVGKLLKHEIAALGKLMFPVLCAVLGVGVFTRILQFFASDSVTYAIVETSSYVILFIAMFVSVILALIFGVVRYYKNLFTGEGYLTFTLPVTASQHIWIKAVVAVMFMAGAVVASVVALAIAFLGRDLADLWDAFVYLWKLMVQKDINVTHIVFYAIEGIILLIAYAFMMFFLYYSCITIGQTAKKNRVAMAVLVYFIYYVITQVLGTIFIILLSVYEYLIPMEKIVKFVEKNTYLCGHLFLIGFTVFFAIMVLIYYLICHTIIRKKLNLE